jgi:hypothetical protein
MVGVPLMNHIFIDTYVLVTRSTLRYGGSQYE